MLEMGHYGLMVRFTVQDDENKMREFDRLAAVALEKIQLKEPGTLLYVTHRMAEKPHQRIFYELYTNKAAHAFHMDQPWVKEFLTKSKALLAKDMEVTELESIAGKGVPDDAGPFT